MSSAERLNEQGIAVPVPGMTVFVDVTGHGNWRPAIVTRTWGEGLTVQLTVLLDASNDIRVRDGLHMAGALAYASSVMHISETDESNLCWTWDYLEVESGETDETQS